MLRICCFLVFTLLLPSMAWAKVQIFVSVTPLKYFVERIGGEHVSVEVMVQPGHSPVTYEPTPRQMAALSTADVYIRIGAPFEASWLAQILEINPQLELVDARRDIRLLPLKHSSLEIAVNEHADHAHNHEVGDPHVWLDPNQAKTIADNIKDQLIRIDQENAAAYEHNTQQFRKELDELDQYIRQLMEDIQNPKFLVFHPAWTYFAQAYGLEQISVEHEGKEPGPNTLARLIDRIKQMNISAVFVQRQFSTQVAATLAAEIDGEVVVLDPLAENYFENLRAAARAIASAQTPSSG